LRRRQQVAWREREKQKQQEMQKERKKEKKSERVASGRESKNRGAG